MGTGEAAGSRRLRMSLFSGGIGDGISNSSMIAVIIYLSYVEFLTVGGSADIFA
jgi:hypothetical protein